MTSSSTATTTTATITTTTSTANTTEKATAPTMIPDNNHPVNTATAANAANESSKDNAPLTNTDTKERTANNVNEGTSQWAGDGQDATSTLKYARPNSDYSPPAASLSPGLQGSKRSPGRRPSESESHHGLIRGDNRPDNRRSREHSNTRGDTKRPRNDNSSAAASKHEDRTANGHRNDRGRSQHFSNSKDYKDKSDTIESNKRQPDGSDRSARGRDGGRESAKDKDGRGRAQDQRYKDDRQQPQVSRYNQGREHQPKDRDNKERESKQQKDGQAKGAEGERPDPLNLLSITGRMGSLTPHKPFFGNSRIVDDFEKLNKVGEGTYGVVYRARDKKTEEVVALKRIRMERENDGLPISSLREIKLLKTLRHDNIVLVKDVVVGSDLDQIFLVMEYCEQDMAALMDNFKKPYTPAEVKCLMYQLLKGMEYCHDHYVVHRDLKLSNLLLNANGILKIADFGLARSFGLPSRPMTPKVVTLWYRAPELLFGDLNYTTAVDMWSAGCIFGELLQHAPLLPGKVEKQQVDLIIELLGTPHEKIWQGFNRLPMSSIKLPEQRFNNLRNKFPNITDAARSLLSGLLTYDPKKRLSVKQALAHPYFIESPPAKHPSLLPTHPEIRNISVTRNEENAKLKRQAPGGDETESISSNRKRMR
ncbi:Cyclin-dependent kinase 10 [Gamsiella multidivaricata]|nr:Cyclin-dependent kinase 10 [Gamsiella multidivaricata]